MSQILPCFLKLRVTALLLLGFAIAVSASAQPGQSPMGDPSDVAAEIQTELGLDEAQTEQVTQSLLRFAQSLESLHAQQEAAEEPDGQAMMAGIKQARSILFQEMKGTMSAEQYAAFEQLIDEVMNEIFTTVAEIKLIDMQQPLALSDAQLEQLAPVMGGSIRSVINLVMENSDKRMGVRQKLKLARSMKKIKADADAQMKTILTPQQQQQLEAYREQRES